MWSIAGRSCPKAETYLPKNRRYASNKLLDVVHKEVKIEAAKRGLPLDTIVVSKDELAEAQREKFERDFSNFKTGYERPFLKAWHVLQQANSPFSNSKLILGLTEQEKREAHESFGSPTLLGDGFSVKPLLKLSQDQLLAEDDKLIAADDPRFVNVADLPEYRYVEEEKEEVDIEDKVYELFETKHAANWGFKWDSNLPESVMDSRALPEDVTPRLGRFSVDENDNTIYHGGPEEMEIPTLQTRKKMDEFDDDITPERDRNGPLKNLSTSSVLEAAEEYYKLPPVQFFSNDIETSFVPRTPYNKPLPAVTDNVIMSSFYGTTSVQENAIKKQRNAVVGTDDDFEMTTSLQDDPSEERNWVKPAFATKKPYVPIWSMTPDQMVDPRYPLDPEDPDAFCEDHPLLLGKGEDEGLENDDNTEVLDSEAFSEYEPREVEEIPDAGELDPEKKKKQDKLIKMYRHYSKWGPNLPMIQSTLDEKELHHSIMEEILKADMIASPMTADSILDLPITPWVSKRNLGYTQERDEYSAELVKSTGASMSLEERWFGHSIPEPKRRNNVARARKQKLISDEKRKNIYWCLPRATSKEAKLSHDYDITITEQHEIKLPGDLPSQKLRIRKVTAKIVVQSLRLSPPALARLHEIAGRRIEDGVLTLPIDRFFKREDNFIYLKKLIRALIDESWKADLSYVSLDNLKNLDMPLVELENIFDDVPAKLSLLHYAE